MKQFIRLSMLASVLMLNISHPLFAMQPPKGPQPGSAQWHLEQVRARQQAQQKAAEKAAQKAAQEAAEAAQPPPAADYCPANWETVPLKKVIEINKKTNELARLLNREGFYTNTGEQRKADEKQLKDKLAFISNPENDPSRPQQCGNAAYFFDRSAIPMPAMVDTLAAALDSATDKRKELTLNILNKYLGITTIGGIMGRMLGAYGAPKDRLEIPIYGVYYELRRSQREKTPVKPITFPAKDPVIETWKNSKLGKKYPGAFPTGI